MVALDRTRKTLTLSGTSNINQLTNSEDFYGKLITSLQFGKLIRINAKLSKTTTSLDTSLAEVTRLSFVYTTSLFNTERQLHGSIAISFYGLDLRDAIGRHVQHSYRNGNTILSKNAGHANLATDKT